MRLNLGCGTDRRDGFLNVDFRADVGADLVRDLAVFPWPWADGTADEILMHDFLEHFPYAKTDPLLKEAWRVAALGGVLDVQVPDFAECSRVVENRRPFQCNRCGWEFPEHDYRASSRCGQCKQGWFDIAIAAVGRLYGGQDYSGNFHLTTFTVDLMRIFLMKNGFEPFDYPERNQNGETYRQNWNFRIRARKRSGPLIGKGAIL